MNSQYKEKAVIRIVDDDEGFGDAIRFMLKTDGWLVSYYSETGTFLKKDDLDVPGCIILDYQMPLVNGLEFQDILAHRGYRQPIIFLTAHADVDMAISAFRSGAADILKKPVSSEILLEAVERAVERDFAFRQKDFRIVRDHLAGHHLAHIGFSAWIADHRRSTAHENDRRMARALHMRHRHQLNKVTDMEAVRRRIEPDVEFHLFPAEHFFQAFMGRLLNKASFL